MRAWLLGETLVVEPLLSLYILVYIGLLAWDGRVLVNKSWSAHWHD